jgi:asparagine synthase (glutamine-hydrolysing)
MDNICRISGFAKSDNSYKLMALDSEKILTMELDSKKASIALNGTIYNCNSSSDTEFILTEYLKHGINCLQNLNGVFSLVIYDDTERKLYMVRDRLGVKPLFYTILNDTLIFASELKGILNFPGFNPRLDRDGLCEIFGLGPAKTYGSGIFKDVYEVIPGTYIVYHKSTLSTKYYWKLESHPHEDSYEATVEKTKFLITDAVKLQMSTDKSICSFLSGGIDSSIVTALCSSELDKLGKALDTYSFDFKDNDINFKANSFQPSLDRPYVDMMISHCHTNHEYLECTNTMLYDYLFEAVDARDLPCMADIDASMLYFCKLVSKNHKVAFTGECADEIFGGYPWFHRPEYLDSDIFPWSMDFSPRTMLLKDNVIKMLPLKEYAYDAYNTTLSEVPILSGETGLEKRRREIAYLNIKWFMQTLLDRMDRSAFEAGIDARVPFADYRLVEYIWNVPWNMKCRDNVVKGLLRESAKGLVPDEILYRKKSPYPKTYDTAYENMLRTAVVEMLSDTRSPLRELIDISKVLEFIKKPSDYGKPFYGQLMSGPQLLAYLLQINYWLIKYNIDFSPAFR